MSSARQEVGSGADANKSTYIATVSKHDGRKRKENMLMARVMFRPSLLKGNAGSRI